jgi:hypothetical protein
MRDGRQDFWQVLPHEGFAAAHLEVPAHRGMVGVEERNQVGGRGTLV